MFYIRPTSKQLIADLNAMYPEASPNPQDNDREVWMRAGERRLVRMLLRAHEKQNERVE